MEIVIDYSYQYGGDTQIISFGNGLLGGYLTLTGKTRVKDDISGQTKTGIIKIPKLKLMSDLSMRLGKEADPAIVNFKGSGYPVGTRGRSYVCHFITLNDDVDAYM